MARHGATQKQKKVASFIIENSTLDSPLNGGEILAKVGYPPSLIKQPGKVINSLGVQQELEESGFTEDNAKRVVSEILLNEKVNPGDRINAAKEVFKVRGTYAPEKKLTLDATPLLVKIIDAKSNGDTEGVQPTT